MTARIAPSPSVALRWLAAAMALAFVQNAHNADGGEIDPGIAFAERVDVELVNVDIWVTDPQGEPVTGLSLGDFEIRHDDQEVPITHFIEVRRGAEYRQPAPGSVGMAESSVSASSSEPAAAIPNHVVVYFDQSRLHPRDYPALIRGLDDFLAAEGIEPERVLIMRQDQGLFVEAPFGSSKVVLEDALAKVAKGAPSGLGLEAETEQVLQAVRDSWEQSQDAVGSASSGLAAIPGSGGGSTPGGGNTAGGPRAVVGGVGSGAGPDACGMFVNQVQPILDSFTRSGSQRIGVTLSNLGDTISFLAGLPGIKTLLYLSDGLDSQPGGALASYASGFCPAGAADLLSGSMSNQLTGALLELTRHANSNRVTIYSLQASGLRSPEVASARSGRRARGSSARSRGAYESSQRVGERGGLSLIADKTGGRAIFNQNEPGTELVEVARDLQSYYSVAYRPPADDASDAKKRRREHRIEVRLGDDSLKARYRRGYLEKDDDRWLMERIQGALNLGITSNPLEVKIGAGEVRPGAADGPRTSHIPLHVMVPVERLTFLPHDGSSVAEVTIRAMARSLESGALASRTQTYRIKGSPGAAGWADLVIELELGSGGHLTALGVRDLASREASFVSTTLDLGPGG